MLCCQGHAGPLVNTVASEQKVSRFDFLSRMDILHPTCAHFVSSGFLLQSITMDWRLWITHRYESACPCLVCNVLQNMSKVSPYLPPKRAGWKHEDDRQNQSWASSTWTCSIQMWTVLRHVMWIMIPDDGTRMFTLHQHALLVIWMLSELWQQSSKLISSFLLAPRTSFIYL